MNESIDFEENFIKIEVSEQQGREFSSANQVAGAIDETVQISGTWTAFSLVLRNHFLVLPSGKTSYKQVMKSRFVSWDEAI
jgi:hypothetical protein